MTDVATRPTVLRAPDALAEAAAAITARPGPAILTSACVMLAVAWFVAALGLISTAQGAVAEAFAARLPTSLTITAPASRLPDPPFPYPADVSARLAAMPGVVAAGVWWPVRLDRGPVTVGTGPGSGLVAGRRPPVIAAGPGFLAAAGVKVGTGRAFDAWDQAHAAGACLVGSALARRLGIAGPGGQAGGSPAGRQQVIYLGGLACAVTGIVASAPVRPALLGSVILPASAATMLFGPPGRPAGGGPEILVRVRPGAAATVARLAPYEINAAAPGQFSVAVRPSPVQLDRQVAGALHGLFAIACWAGAAFCLIGISGFSYFSVAQRLPELSLRRALGARRRHIAVQVLTESALLGLLGGLAGAGLGVAVIVLAAHAMGWTPVADPVTLWPAPIAGACAGLVAGFVPAARAAWIRPARGLSKFAPL
jgi:putative ABC transport system permease protein